MRAGMRKTLMSAALLALTAMDVMNWIPLSHEGPGCLGGLMALAYLILAAMLWSGGVRKAGTGLARWLFLMAFAAPMVAFGLGLADLPRDMWKGFEAGYQSGGGYASQHVAPPANPRTPVQHWVAWVALTTLLATVLNRLERRSAEAEHQAELAKEARSQALAAKLAPHFIFNTLNTLHAQIEVDPQGAQATTEKLAELFRQVVAVVTLPTIPLRQELAFVEAYLGIEQARLGERLRVNVEIPEDLEAAKVPPLSLQVLVENAVKHGVAPLEAGGEIRIGAEKKEGFLHLWVEDPGPGISTQRGTGTALETLRQRLESPVDLELGMVEGRHRVSFRWRMA